MQRIDDAGRAAPLVLELVSGTARLHGEELELPLREFRLLAALAKRVGEPVTSAELIGAVWPGDAEWTSKEDLYVLVSKLRRLIDGPTKFGKNIRNRRGFGYMLDLESAQVVIVAPPSDEEAAQRIVYLDESKDAPAPEVSLDAEPQSPALEAEAPAAPQEITPSKASVRPHVIAGALALVLALLAGTWAAGYLLSQRNADRSDVSQGESDVEPQGKTGNPPGKGETEKPGAGRDHTGRRKQDAKGENRKQHRENAQVVVAAPGSSTDVPNGNPTNPSDPQNSAQGSRKSSKKDQPPPPAAPPAPTRYLYHLVNQKTGDHFVTTDADVVSSYQGRGYQGGAIARIYTSAEDNTKAITTNRGTAYIFQSSAPKTKPASSTLPLWYVTDDNGDFFYTTSESEASADGWRSSIIGYVRTP